MAGRIAAAFIRCRRQGPQRIWEGFGAGCEGGLEAGQLGIHHQSIALRRGGGG